MELLYTEQCSVYKSGSRIVAQAKCAGDWMMQDEAAKPERRVRADAQRNEDALLAAAKEVFSELGVDAPVREIAARADVGMGTLYRRFPKRSDLVAGVFRREVDACTKEAMVLAEKYSPGEALAHWLERYAAFLRTKKGLAAALNSGDPAFDTLPDYFRGHFEPALETLLDAAASVGDVRGDIEPYDLLRAIGNLSVAGGEEGAAHTQRMMCLLIDGLRFGANQPGGDAANKFSPEQATRSIHIVGKSSGS